MMRLARAGAVAALLTPPLTELRLTRAAQPLTGRWRKLPVQPRGMTQLGVSFRPLQATALGLDPQAALQALLAYPFQLIRLAAYWNQMEPRPGAFQPGGLDRQLDAAERAGKQVILCVGPVKAFGYPEFFVPAHHLSPPLREGALVRPDEYRRLLEAGTAFAVRVVERYRNRAAVIAWQVEHEAVDPLGVEHSWRLSEAFVRSEVEAVRAANPGQAGHDEWFPANLDSGPAPAVVAHQGPGGLAVGGTAAGQHRRHRLLPAARPGERRATGPVPGRQPGPVAAAAAGTAAGPDGEDRRRNRHRPLRGRRAASDDRRGAGRTVGGRHDAAQPGRPGHVQLPPRRPDRELQPVHALDRAGSHRRGRVPVLGGRVLAAPGAAG